MQEKNVLGFKKNKSYGLCGVMLTMLFLGTCGVTAGADEVMENPSNANATKSISREQTTSSRTVLNSETVTKVEKQTSEINFENSNTTETSESSFNTVNQNSTEIISQDNADYTVSSNLTNNSVTTSAYQGSDSVDSTSEGQSHFLNAIKQGAMDGAKEGVLPSITAAQAILESGWGKSSLAQAPNHNLFGIKNSDDWGGDTVLVPTQEYVNGSYITINAAFRKYSSWNDSVVDHAKFFTSTEWRKNNYRKVINATDYRTAAQELKNAGYATDPGYAGKLIRLIEAYKLYEWDEESHTASNISDNPIEDQNSPKADLAVTSLNNATGSYDVLISNLVAPYGFKEVLVPTWSEKNGQDDIIW